MLASERRKGIAAAVTMGVRTEELAADFGVSAETIRRDLIRLQSDGLLQRVHGGAAPAEKPRAIEAAFLNRRTMNLASKHAMAALAVSLVEPGAIVVIDVGTTALEVARSLPETWGGTVITNSLLVGAELAERAGVEVVSLGGRIRAGDLACSGPQALAALSELYADVAFLGSGGLDATAGLTDYYSDEVDVRRLMIRHSRQCYVLADSSKFGVVSARSVCPLSELSGLITDEAPKTRLSQALHDADVQILAPTHLAVASPQ